MVTLTIDIINEKAVSLLKDLEKLQLIVIHKNKSSSKKRIDLAHKYSGAMAGQTIEEIDSQLKELRNEWE